MSASKRGGLSWMIWVGVLVTTMCFQACNDSAKARDVQAKARTSPKMSEYLAPGNMHVGSPVFLRAIKEDKILELWVQPKGSGSFVLVKRYPVAAMSGNLGPKEKEGDNQVPEGFYEVVPAALNPNSKYHLSFNIGYPNEYDRSLGRTGSYIMVHGSDVSAGCIAITDEGIEEVYTMVAEALKEGQKTVPIQIYPFVPTPARLWQERKSPYFPFWKVLEKTWEWTDLNKMPAPIVFENNQLVMKIPAPLQTPPPAPEKELTQS
ncbi:L,D-transpeptidase family protein [Akkermansia sp. N21169]|uniref:L,D-transpeptidase family protein n=1 Tax=Akkermansia sp. N21169 TaxID=3040765 RepID=UPI00244EE223|nr:L,D-transpeptidase family protein [Akkermansia sp. N21169]MDH3069140.1 L,D-transpeptidase family protein [Akkermansia sp. N21169]